MFTQDELKSMQQGLTDIIKSIPEPTQEEKDRFCAMNPHIVYALRTKPLITDCVHASKMAYGNFNSGRLTILEKIQVKSDECHIFQSKKIGKIIFAFTGTQKDDPRDFLTDAEIRLVQFGDIKAKVHHGFFKSFKRLRNDVTRYIRESGLISDKDVVFTGHSLGGAVASLFASTNVCHSAYTFGSPRAVDKDFKKYTNPKNLYRIYNKRDLVSYLPKKRVLFFKSGYTHIGHPIPIGSHGIKRFKKHSIDEYIKLVEKL